MKKEKGSEREPVSGDTKRNWLAEIDSAVDFKQRMYLCSELVGNVNALASAAGISQSGIRNYFAGSDPNREILSRLARAAGVRFEWLGEGTGPMRELPPILVHSVLQAYRNFCVEHSVTDSIKSKRRFVAEYNGGTVKDAKDLNRLLPRIALIELKDWTSETGIGTTAGAYTQVSEVISKSAFGSKPTNQEHIMFSTEWLTSELKIKPEHISQWRVEGEAMAPTICPGDLVLIDRTASTGLPGDGIYIVRLDDVILPKRIQWMGQKRILLKSDNSAYRDVELDLDRQDGGGPRFSIIGRVVWFGRRI